MSRAATSPLLSGSGVPADSRSRVASSVASSGNRVLDVAAIDRALNSLPKEFLVTKDFNPFSHYDDDSNDLRHYQQVIDGCIQQIVDVHHKAFNSATAAFTHVLTTFSDTQQTVKTLTQTLTEARRLLTTRNQTLKDYWQQSSNNKAIVVILEEISFVLRVPHILDTYIQHHQYVHCVILLTHTLTLCSDEQLREIEGLVDLREELLARKNTLTTQLIEQTQAVIYNKVTTQHATHSNHTDSNPTSHRASTSGSGSRDSSVRKEDTTRSSDSQPVLARTNSAAASTSLTSQPNTQNPVHDDLLDNSPFSPFPAIRLDTSSRGTILSSIIAEERSDAYLANPYANPSRLMFLLVSASDYLNALPSLKTNITKKVRQEISAIIDKQTELAKDRRRNKLGPSTTLAHSQHPAAALSAYAKSRHRSRLPQRLAAAHLNPDSTANLIDLLDSVFPALLSVLKHLQDIIGIINTQLNTKAGGSPTATTASDHTNKWSAPGVWEIIQIQVQIMLHEYLSNTQLNALNAESAGMSMKKMNDPKQKTGNSNSPNELTLTFSFEDSSAASIARMSRGAVSHEQVSALQQLTKRTNKDKEEQKWILATPYNITVIYRSVISFTDQANAMIYGSNKYQSMDSTTITQPTQAEAHLRQFLSMFISSSLLPRLQADVNIEMDDVFADPHAFDEIQLNKINTTDGATAATATGQQQIKTKSLHTFLLHDSSAAGHMPSSIQMKAIVDIAAVVDKLLHDLYHLPHSTKEYLQIIEQIISRVVERCSERYMEICRGNYAATVLMDTKLMQIMATEEAFKQYQATDNHSHHVGQSVTLAALYHETQPQQPQQPASPSPRSPKSPSTTTTTATAASSFFTAKNPLYAPFFDKDFSLRKEQLLTDARSVSQLCLMCESLEWLADHLFSYTHPINHPRHSHKTHKPASTSSRNRFTQLKSPKAASDTAVNTATVTSFRIARQRDNKTHQTTDKDKDTSKPSSSVLDARFWSLCNICQTFSDRCLFTVRFDFHTHIYYYLSQMKSSHYAQNQSVPANSAKNEPEPFILSLNTDINQLDEWVHKYWHTPKIDYLYADSYLLLSELFITHLSFLQEKRVDAEGVDKLHVNLFAIQQQFTNLLFYSKHVQHWDRVRAYVDLLVLSQEELQEGEQSKRFTREQIAAIAAISAPNRQQPH